MSAMEDLTAYQKHYRKDPTKHKKRAAERTKRVRKETQEYLDSIRADSSCSDCNARYPDKPWRMSFDHLPQFEKVANVCDAIRLGWGRKKIDEEISKCEIVCLLCHADRTHDRRASSSMGEQRAGSA